VTDFSGHVKNYKLRFWLEANMPKVAQAENSRWAKANRTEVVALRLDPKRRLLLELAARKARVPAAKFVESALDAALDSETWTTGGKKEKLSILVDEIWSTMPSLCFVQRAQMFGGNMLTHEEEILWELIQRSGLMDHPKHWPELEKRWDKFKDEASKRAQDERLYLVPGVPDEEAK
jgi:hypothetical protein